MYLKDDIVELPRGKGCHQADRGSPNFVLVQFSGDKKLFLLIRLVEVVAAPLLQEMNGF
jgi:hypothetical protein